MNIRKNNTCPALQKLLNNFIKKETKDLFTKKSKLNVLKEGELKMFLDTGIPNKEIEGWRHTKLSWGEGTNNHVGGVSKKKLITPGFLLTIVNGQPRLKESNIPNYISLKELNTLSEDEALNLLKKTSCEKNVFTKLNNALVKSGFLLSVENPDLEIVLTIHYINTIPGVSQSRFYFQTANNVKLTIIEQFSSDEMTFQNNTSLWMVGEHSKVTKFRLGESGDENPRSTCINNQFVEQLGSSSFNSYSLYFNDGDFKIAGTIRNNSYYTLLSPLASCSVFSISKLAGQTHIDNNILMKHLAKDCESLQYFNGVFDQESSSVFNSSVWVEKGAQKSNTTQKNNSILLSKNSSFHSVPKLEIFADDVKCNHGATMGQLDERALFYFRSRGVSEEVAKNLILYTFLTEPLQNIETLGMKSIIQNDLKKQLNI